MKVGIFLSSNETSGGTFQYNFTLFKILSEFQDKNLCIVIFYVNPIWESIVKGNKSIKVSFSFFFRLLFRIAIFFKFNLIFLKRIFKYFKCVKLIEGEQCDIIFYPSQDFLSFLLNTPAVVSIHDLMHRYENHFAEYTSGEIIRRDYIYGLICENSKIILSDSNLGRLHIIESYSVEAEKIEVLPFIPPTYFDDCKLVDLQKNYDIVGDFIFYPAAFWEHKNHKNLLIAFKEILLDYPQLSLILVGARKNSYNNTIKLINDLEISKSVSILGFVDNDTIYTLYKESKLMIFVSLLGPTNIPPIEAIYLNCPLVCSKSYSMPEQVGSYGVLVDANNPKDIVRGVFDIFNSSVLNENFSKYNIKRIEALRDSFNKTVVSIINRLN